LAEVCLLNSRENNVIALGAQGCGDTGGSQARLPLSQRDDDELMVLAREGVEAAFDQLIRRHQGRGLLIAQKYLGGAEGAKDAVQNAFIQLYRYVPRYKPQGQFKAYLYRIILNQCRMTARSGRTRQRLTDQLPAPVPSQASSEEAVLARERAKQTERAVAQLSVKLRAVVVLRYSAGLTHPEIASQLGIPLSTVKSRLFEAFKQLRRTLGGSLA
jgi:RNA polymerase sigma-70 factor (ECF subfamily)